MRYQNTLSTAPHFTYFCLEDLLEVYFLLSSLSYRVTTGRLPSRVGFRTQDASSAHESALLFYGKPTSFSVVWCRSSLDCRRPTLFKFLSRRLTWSVFSTYSSLTYCVTAARLSEENGFRTQKSVLTCYRPETSSCGASILWQTDCLLGRLMPSSSTAPHFSGFCLEDSLEVYFLLSPLSHIA